MNLNLENKTAIVCGSTQGIGKAAAMEMAGLGANICLVARNEDKLKSVLTELPNNGSQSHAYIAVDFTNQADLKSKLETFVVSQNHIDILLNNTGGPAGGPAHAADTVEYLNAFNQHLICNQIIVQTVLDKMKAADYGRIINVISTSVKQPLNGLGVSNTVRGAVANWAKTLANELGQFNITVNNVLPGATNTVRLQAIAENKAAKTGKSVDEIFADFAAAVPMKRIADAEEIANAIAFLASPAASYINGINVPVDGGRTACL